MRNTYCMTVNFYWVMRIIMNNILRIYSYFHSTIHAGEKGLRNLIKNKLNLFLKEKKYKVLHGSKLSIRNWIKLGRGTYL